MQTPTDLEPRDAPAGTGRESVTIPGATLGHRFADLFTDTGDDVYTRLRPTPLPSPYWVGRSAAMARELGLGEAWFESRESLAVFTGNADIEGGAPLASVYSGHQFGVWAGQLGDGRAILLGELAGQEVQLKGAGLTPYSRMGDGRAVLRSSIREFLASEAMRALGIPTTRALCVTGSDAPVRREEVETAAVVTRVAPSLLRFGHFEHFAYNDRPDLLARLADEVVERFYPECAAGEGFAGNRYAALLAAVTRRTANLMAKWQAVGFCHGVMNTDNMSILGLTIDYGPYQFLDGFEPGHICNHSDTSGRYAYNRQPNIGYWNLFCLGQALLPLIAQPGGNQDLALAALEPYKQTFPDAMEAEMRTKLGLATPAEEGRAADRELIESVLKLLAAERVDYTIFWRRLSHHVAGTPGAAPVADVFLDRAAFAAWLARYEARLGAQDRAATGRAMLGVNPKFVLRNHLGEEAIQAAKRKDFSRVADLGLLLSTPYDEHPGHDDAAGFPPDWAQSIEISCSS